jgi:predicted DNA-binding transcriptional regulator AlpA
MLINTKELAALLHLSVTTIKKYRKTCPEKIPPFIKIGENYRWDKNEVETWLKMNQT